MAGKHIVFAVEIAKQKDYGVFMTGSRQKLATIKWESLYESVAVLDLLKKLPAGQLEVAMEPTGTYGDAFRVMTQDAGIPVYQVGAKRTHDAAEAWDGVPSMHDAKAGEVIARLHLDGASELWERRSDEERELAATVMMIGVHNRAYTSLINNLEAKLARHWPELTEHLDLTLVTPLELLAEMGGPRAVRERPEEAVSLMDGELAPLLAHHPQRRQRDGLAAPTPAERRFAPCTVVCIPPRPQPGLHHNNRLLVLHCCCQAPLHR